MQQGSAKSFTATDALFIIFLGVAVVAVVLLGNLSFQEGLKTEAAKANAAKLKDWFDQLEARTAKGEASPLDACQDDGQKTWDGCKAALLGDKGPLNGAKNPFDALLPVVGAKCDREDLNTRGLVVVEKGTPAPPAMNYGPIESGDTLAKDLPLRIMVCEKGAYALKVAEVKL